MHMHRKNIANGVPIFFWNILLLYTGTASQIIRTTTVKSAKLETKLKHGYKYTVDILSTYISGLLVQLSNDSGNDAQVFGNM